MPTVTASVRVKICGITRLEDAERACVLGADALGFNFWPGSKRYCRPAVAKKIVSQLPPFVVAVGVFVNQSREEILRVVKSVGLAVVQLHGDESKAFASRLSVPVIKAIRVDGPGAVRAAGRFSAAAILLDAATPGFGGSGQRFNWAWADSFRSQRPLILAGGLTPANVRAAVRRVRPFAVDVASGVESSPGIKDPKKMARFIREAKEA